MENGRRKFLGVCLGGLAATTIAAVLYPIFRYLAPRSDTNSSKKINIAAKEIPDGGVKFFEYAGSAAVVVKTGSEIIALSAVCSHLGCIIQWEKEKQAFLCPCHAGRYTKDGSVISGPPPRSLTKLPFIVDNDMIVIG
ncbi:MAG TPA: Rieske 2Fe-2S domain-containing protein [Desulfuromonadaceae bacterium]|jgi:cytochrome b6-f complex iron-sulfur subunit